MRKELLKKVMEITPEEQKILDGEALNRDLYTNNSVFTVDSEKMLSFKKYITVRTHTRFVDFPEHGHKYIEMMYVCHGSITHIINGREICMLEGDVLFMNRHVKHSIKKAGINDIGINFIVLPEFFDIPLIMLKEDEKNVLADFIIDALKIHGNVPQYLHFKSRGNTDIENLMENIIRSLIYENDEYENINQITMGLIFLHLLHNMETIDNHSMQGYKDIILNTVIQYINKKYRDANLTELALGMHQTLANMSKIIKKGTGHTFQELVQKKRFQQSVVFLMETDMSVAEIMNAVGYENSSYFYRRFREKYGVSPKEYRITHKGDKKVRL